MHKLEIQIEFVVYLVRIIVLFVRVEQSATLFTLSEQVFYCSGIEGGAESFAYSLVKNSLCKNMFLVLGAFTTSFVWVDPRCFGFFLVENLIVLSLFLIFLKLCV